MTPIAMATVYELFPPSRRGIALGVWGVSIMAAPALGPPIGGWLGRRGELAPVVRGVRRPRARGRGLATKYLPETGTRVHRSIDGVGWVLLAVGIIGVVIGSRQAAAWGPTDIRVFLVVGTGIIAIALVIVRSLKHPNPIIEFRMFAVPTFALAATAMWLTSVNQPNARIDCRSLRATRPTPRSSTSPGIPR